MPKKFTEEDIVEYSNGEIPTIYAISRELVDSPLWWQKQNLSETASGYGSKLTTRYKINLHGRLYRIYATCYSNVASCWITRNGRKIYIN